jgi:hypothetical protein
MLLIRKHEPDIILRTARPEDFEALVALRIEAMRESLERVGRFDPVRARGGLFGCTGSIESDQRA